MGKRRTKCINFPWYRSIGMKVFLYYMLPVVLILVIGYVSYQQASNTIKEKYVESAMEGIKMTSDYIGFGLEAGKAAAFEVINNGTVTKYYIDAYGQNGKGKSERRIDQEYTSKLLMTKQAANVFIQNIHIISEKKELCSSAGSGIWKEKVKDAKQIAEAYQKFVNEELNGIKLEDGYWTSKASEIDPLIGVKEEDYALRYVRAIPSVKACMVLDISADAIQDVLKGLDYDEQSVAALVMPENKTVQYSRSGNKADLAKYIQAAGKENATEEKSFWMVEKAGEPFYFFQAKVPGSEAVVCCMIPEATVLKQLGRIRFITTMLVIVSCFLACMIAYLFSRNIRHVIDSVNAHLQQIAAGNLDSRLQLKRKDEFLILSRGINQMEDNISKLIEEVRTQSISVTASSDEVKQASQNIAEAMHEAGAMTNQIHEGVLNQTQEADAGYEMMEKLAVEIDSINQKIAMISQIADVTKQTVQMGTLSIEELNHKTESTSTSMNNILVHMSQLNEKSNAIMKIVDTMHGIADETNLLALNAAIEAARVGNAGRGFAVVANEIGSLATDSMNSAKQIEATIHEILTETKEMLGVVENTERVVIEQNDAVTETAYSFEHIYEQVEKLLDQVGRVEENTKTMQEAKTETLLSIQSMAAVSQESVAASESVVDSMQLQAQEVNKLIELSQRLNENASLLEKGIVQFKSTIV